jgi:kumamolisin
MALAVAVAAPVLPAGAAAPRVVKHGSLSPLVARTRDRGRAPRSDRHRVVIALALRQRDALEAFLADIQDPGSPRYHQFITQEEFNALYAPDPADEEAVVAHLAQNGLTVTERAPNRLVVGAVGSVEALERAFGVEIHALDYRGRRHFASMGEPSLPADVAGSVLGVVGLDDLVERRPHLVSVTPVAAPRAKLTSPSHCCALAPQDILNLYDHAPTYDGSGETIVIAGAYAWDDADNSGFAAEWGLPGLPAGSGQVCTGPAASAACQFSAQNSIEVALDVEYAHGVAPGARILNYMARTTALVDFTTAYNRIVTDNPGHVVTTSWGACESDIPSGTLAADDAIFANANAIGQSWFAASGDSGSRDCHNTVSVDNPASSPHVIGTGGTTPTCSSGLTPASPACAGYGSETAWSGSGGGTSAAFARPTFQTGCGVPAGTQRLVPDVALESDPSPGNYVMQAGRAGGPWFIVAGTSVAAPEWAAFLAALDQRAGGTGFGNPGALFYGLCGTAAFHDVTSGSNGDFTAGTGYDRATGLGTISADTFFAAAVPAPATTSTTVSTSSSTTITSTTSSTVPTTSTVPACPAEGFSGLRCALAGGLDRPECAEDTFRRRVARRFRVAMRLIGRAEQAVNTRRASRLVTRSAAALGSAERLVARANVSAECSQALVAMLEDGRERADVLAASLQALKR